MQFKVQLNVWGIFHKHYGLHNTACRKGYAQVVQKQRGASRNSRSTFRVACSKRQGKRSFFAAPKVAAIAPGNSLNFLSLRSVCFVMTGFNVQNAIKSKSTTLEMLQQVDPCLVFDSIGYAICSSSYFLQYIAGSSGLPTIFGGCRCFFCAEREIFAD